MQATNMQDSNMQATITKGASSHKDNIDENYYFAILEIEAPKLDLNDMDGGEYHYIFNLDRSGSMSIKTPSDSSTKMQQTIHTMINIIKWMQKDVPNDHYITIILFDHLVETIADDILINETSATSLIAQIQQVTPRGCTNIEQALQEANKVINKFEENMEIIHIFMTDGIPTDGNVQSSVLAELASATKKISKAYYIGFGLDHNSTLLQTLAATHNNEYHFADNLETCGMVYSDILHEILYKYQDAIILNTKGFEIYNYKNNKWETSYMISNLVFNTTKTYHIRQPTKNQEIIELTYTIPGHRLCFQSLEIEFKPDDDLKVENHIWRQRTLEILYKLQKSLFTEKKANLFLEQLKAYMKETDQKTSAFLQTLVDDIYIAVKVKDTEYQDMYTRTRQSSQGAQRGYTVKNVEQLVDVEEHIFSQTSATNYGNLNYQKLTRSLSQGTQTLNKPPSSPIKRSKTAGRSASLNAMGSLLIPDLPHYDLDDGVHPRTPTTRNIRPNLMPPPPPMKRTGSRYQNNHEFITPPSSPPLSPPPPQRPTLITPPIPEYDHIHY